jgi:MFS family permease
MVAQPAMMALLSPFAGRLSDRLGSRLLSTSGMVLVALGMVMLATVPITAGIARVMASLAVVGIGMAAFSAPNTSAIMGSVERSKLSLASAFLSTMRVTGQALSVAVLGGIAASQLGVSGTRLIYTNGQAGGAAAHGALHGGTAAAAAAASVAAHIVQNYALGYKYAMFTGAGLALAGALASLTRPTQVLQAPRPPLAPAVAPSDQ